MASLPQPSSKRWLNNERRPGSQKSFSPCNPVSVVFARNCWTFMRPLGPIFGPHTGPNFQWHLDGPLPLRANVFVHLHYYSSRRHVPLLLFVLVKLAFRVWLWGPIPSPFSHQKLATNPRSPPVGLSRGISQGSSAALLALVVCSVGGFLLGFCGPDLGPYNGPKFGPMFLSPY